MPSYDSRIEGIINLDKFEKFTAIFDELLNSSEEMLEALAAIRMMPSRQGGKTAFSRAVMRLQEAISRAEVYK